MKDDRFQVWDIGVDAPCTPQDALPEPPGGAYIIITGRAPIWRYGYAFHQVHGTTSVVATHDPRLGGAVVVASHDPEYRQGDLVEMK